MAAPGSIPASVIGLEVVSIQFLIPKAALILAGHNIALVFSVVFALAAIIFFESGIYHNDSDALQDHCEIM